MENNKSNDDEILYLDEAYYNKIHDMIDKWYSEGKTEEEIDACSEVEFPKLCENMIDNATQDYYKITKEKMYEVTLDRILKDNIFLSNLENDWGDCFLYSYAFYDLILDIVDRYRDYVDKFISYEHRKENEYTFVVLINIHARIVQIYLEVLCLMKNGFADGAYGRWRTMYELCCYLYFIKEAGEETAVAYFKQSETAENNTSWAKTAKCFKNMKENPSINQIKKKCPFGSMWEKHYKLGCAVNHGGPQSTFGRMSNPKNCNLIPVGRSDGGLVTPAEHSTLILALATNCLLTLFPSAEFTAMSNVIEKWMDDIREKYFARNDELFIEDTHKDFLKSREVQ